MGGKASSDALKRAQKKYYEKNAAEIKRKAREHRAENAAAVRKYRAENLEKVRASNRESKRAAYAKGNARPSSSKREKARVRMREIVNPSRYGLTLSAIETMMAEQGGKCAICTRELGKYRKTVHVDHCHKTGRNRGILCHACNVSIGLLLESTEILQRAIDYLVKHGAVAYPLPALESGELPAKDVPQLALFH